MCCVCMNIYIYAACLIIKTLLCVCRCVCFWKCVCVGPWGAAPASLPAAWVTSLPSRAWQAPKPQASRDMWRILSTFLLLYLSSPPRGSGYSFTSDVDILLLSLPIVHPILFALFGFCMQAATGRVCYHESLFFLVLNCVIHEASSGFLSREALKALRQLYTFWHPLLCVSVLSFVIMHVKETRVTAASEKRS